MLIKVCGITEKMNMIRLGALEPDLMGFIFYRHSARYMREFLKPDDMDQLTSEIPKTGVFVNSSLDEVRQTARLYKLNYIQLHGYEPPEFCKFLMDEGLQVIKAFGLNKNFDFSLLKDYIDYTRYFLFDTSSEKFGGSGEKFNWDILRNYDLGQPFILSGGIGPDDAQSLFSFEHAAFAGIDLNSRFEDYPGIKNIEKLKHFMEIIRNHQWKNE